MRVFPRAGGVGLCELVQHLAMADYVAISGSMNDRAIEFVDHLHEHFVDPVVIASGRYMVPTSPGFSAEMRAESLEQYLFPDGVTCNGVAPGSYGARSGTVGKYVRYRPTSRVNIGHCMTAACAPT